MILIINLSTKFSTLQFDFYLKIRYAGVLNKTTGRFCQLIRMFLMKYQGIWGLLILNISTLI